MTLPHSLTLLLIATSAMVGGLDAQSAPSPEAGAASWIGKYTGSGLEFELKQSAFGLFGMLSRDGIIYHATARPEGNTLTGTFRSGSDSFPYVATRTGHEVRFVTGGTEYLLRRASAPAASSSPANPLARRGVTEPPVQPPAAAAPATPSPTPAAGQLVELSLGFSLRLPPGWTATETPEGVLLLPAGVRFDPASVNNPEVYIAAIRNDYDPRAESQLVQQLSASINQGGGTRGQRQASKFGQRQGAVYRWEVRDPQSGRLAALEIFLAAEGSRAFVIIAAGEKARVRANEASIRQVLASAEYASPKPAAAGALADSTPLAQRWLAKLRGKIVRQFWASQGMSSDKKHWLNADGTYAFKSSSMVSVDVPGASALSTGNDDSTGRWRIRDLGGEVFLEVRYNNGNVSRMPITEDSRNMYLNGEKAFPVDP